MARPMVIIRVRVFTPDGAVHRLEEHGELTEYSIGLPVTWSKRHRWVRYDNGERSWMCSGLPFEIEHEELPL